MEDKLKELLVENAKIVDTEIQNAFPREFSTKWFESVFGETKYEYDPVSCTSSISKPVIDLLERGGKRWRPLLMRLCYDCAKSTSRNDSILNSFMPIVEFIHNGTLMVDDVEDNSENRRGKPCINKTYGVDYAINTGNFMYYFPYFILKNIEVEDDIRLLIHELIAEEMLKLHFGQGMDIDWHNNFSKVSEGRYLQMCAYKTGTLARMSAKIGAILGEASVDEILALGEFAESIGIAFQIQDDILNLTNKDWGKDFGDDITEGKKSLIIIKTFEHADEDDRERLIEILEMGTKSRDLIEEAVKIIEKYPGIEYSKRFSRKIVTDAWEKLDSMLRASEAKNNLKLFADFMIEREI